jgi:dTDP-4-amino-4,6-dideoxygalactose transaminase
MPVLNEEMKESAMQVLDNEMLVGGENVIKFEQEFAKFVRTDYAISTNSGSSTLLLIITNIKSRFLYFLDLN